MRRSNYDSHLMTALVRQNAALIGVVALSITCALQAAYIYQMESAERTRIVPVSLREPFTVSGDRYSPEYLRQITEWAAAVLLNYTPETYEHTARTFLDYIHPDARGAMAARLQADLTRVKEKGLSSTFYLREVQLRGNDAVVFGLLKTSIGSHSVEDRRAAFRFAYEVLNTGAIAIRDYQEVDYENPYGEADPATGG